MQKVHVAVVYVSRYGHTKRLAEAVAAGANAIPGAEAALFSVAEAKQRPAALDLADALIFGAPTYMGSMASEMKAFFEDMVVHWYKQNWQDKIAGGFTNSANFSGDKLNTMQGILTAAMQFGMIWVGVGDLVACNTPETRKTLTGPGPEAVNRNSASLGPMASSFDLNAPASPPPGDMETAFNYGKRLARTTFRFVNGPLPLKELNAPL